MKTNYKWTFAGTTTYGKSFSYTVSANDKTTAIKKGFDKLRKNGEDSIHWNCNLIRV